MIRHILVRWQQLETGVAWLELHFVVQRNPIIVKFISLGLFLLLLFGRPQFGVTRTVGHLNYFRMLKPI